VQYKEIRREHQNEYTTFYKPYNSEWRCCWV